jgi:methionyl-tRNA formyltransferase
MRVLLLAPIRNSLYARILGHLIAQEPGLELVGIVVRRPWSWNRIRGELRRDGPRLLKKVYQKLVLGDEAFKASPQRNLLTVAQESGLTAKTLQTIAAQAGCPCLTVGDHNDQQSLDMIRAQSPDAIAFTGGGLIRRDLLGIPKLGVLNCHMGQLPPYRGMDVVEWPVLETTAGFPPLGLTVHSMDAGVDTGPLLRVEKFELEPTDDFARIRERLTARMPTMMFEVLQDLRDQRVAPVAQASADGRQYFVLHPRLYSVAQAKLAQRLSPTS